jgi:outer membrane protein assembly factor BamB
VKSLLLTMALALLATPLFAQNWPQFGGPTQDGVSPSKNLPTEWSETKNVKWKTPIHGQGWSCPVIWGDQIWLTTATLDGKQMSVLCVDAATGKIIHDKVIFENEKLDFKHEFNSFASCTPALEEGRVYVHFGSYGTACLDAKTAEVIWQRRDLPCNHWRGPGSSPIIHDGKVIINFDGYDHQYIVALDKATGETIWKSERTHDYGTDDGDQMKAYSTPMVIDVDGAEQLISIAAKAALAYDPKTGKEIWRVRFYEHSSCIRPHWWKGLLLINTGFSKAQILAIDPRGQGDITDTHVRWKLDKSVPNMPSTVIVNDLLYMVHDAGVAQCVDPQDGSVVWSKRLGGKYVASALASGENVYFFSQEGVTTVIRAGRQYEEIAVNQLDDGFMSSAASVGDDLILRTKTHLYRIGH